MTRNVLAAQSGSGRWHRVSHLHHDQHRGTFAACDHRMQLKPPIQLADDIAKFGAPLCRRQGCWPR